ncbi:MULTISPECIES: hypothetical protein [unclassified Rhodococcus (in: high G+C Gram-positive bacteria)]|uniref:hypothetical protein n=1 Tax=Rhodococcus sp. SJ-3 TaxID=3454628 RepID=UPI003F7AA000
MNSDVFGRGAGSGIDPLSGQLDELVAALTTASATASSATVTVRVGADGSVQDLQIDDGALRGGGALLASHLMQVIGRAHAELGERRRAAESALRSDPRIAEAISAVTDAADAPLPRNMQATRRGPEHGDVRPSSFLVPATERHRQY